MNEVKRYGNTWCEVTERTVFKHDQQDGDYVKLSDYTALQEQLSATTNSLTNAQEALKSAGIEADTVQAGVMELVSRMNRLSGDREKFAVQCAAAKIAAQYARAEGFECSLNTPDVDAYLNAVRAEGLDMAAAEIDRWFGCGSLAREIRQKSSQLRAGNAGKAG